MSLKVSEALWRIGYALLRGVIFPLLWLRLWWRGRNEPAYCERWRERRGLFDATVPPGGIWFHAVSAGEVIAAAPVIAKFMAGRPEVAVTVTTMTPSGSERVRVLLPATVQHVYMPFDYPVFVRRFFERVQPRLLVLMETELWPTVLQTCSQRGVTVVLANGRLSEASHRGYARLGSLARRMTAQLNVVACQFDEHARRFAELGVAPDKLRVIGSVKFDLRPPRDLEAQMALRIGQWGVAHRHVWIAASTHDGEDAVVIAAHRQVLAVFPEALVIIVPRHPQRAAAVQRLCAPLTAVPTSSASTWVSNDTHVLVGDRMGELLLLYGLAQVAFVGGSLVDHGGHNVIEPAWHGMPIVCGPSDRNFRDVMAAFESVGALVRVTDASTLARQVIAWFEDGAQRQRAGASGKSVIAANAGALARLSQLLDSTWTQVER